MTNEESQPFDEWKGKEESLNAFIDAWHVRAMAATLDLASAPGDNLPPGWQWMFFNPIARRSGLARDGHPIRGGFLPPIELPRRMWAGSRLRYLAEVPIESVAERHSRITSIERKVGRRGDLWFVTVTHVISVAGRPCIEEEQDIVFREAPSPELGVGMPLPYVQAATWTEEVVVDTTTLFRYSALTFNGHRIHYDAPYAREVEGYPGLVVHGPLIATLLQRFVLSNVPGRLASFEFRGVSPLHVDRPFRLNGRKDDVGDLAKVWATGPDGELAMSATALVHREDQV